MFINRPFFFLLITKLHRLGWVNVLYVAYYKISLKLGFRKFLFPIFKINLFGDFFSVKLSLKESKVDSQNTIEADELLQGVFRFYGFHKLKLHNPPQWFLNPFNGEIYTDVYRHWTELPDFNSKIGDIKNIWEGSRFEWVLILSRAYVLTNEKRYLITLNSWLTSWCNQNPVNQGPNWKCGQETSIRLIQLLNASFFLKQHNNASPNFIEFIRHSLKRIKNNIHYALAQENNHSTSEAAALYVGGLWLENSCFLKEGITYKKLGRNYLEKYVNKLTLDDGSFSQHSITYHRLFLDTMSFVEFWRSTYKDRSFSNLFNTRIISSIKWLNQLTDSISGDAPNLGANDGAFLLNFTRCNYRDFRPTLQLSSVLFRKKRLFDKGQWDEALTAFELDPSSYDIDIFQKRDEILDSSYGVLKNKSSWILLRLPNFKFRPHHNDVHHFDLWIDGKNILCDSGSFSYNPPAFYSSLDLKSVNSHNTVSFDGREQMPKISRFLLGGWLKSLFEPSIVSSNNGNISISSSYRDNLGNFHKRTITKLFSNGWEIVDELQGPFKEATIGFNLNSMFSIENNQIITPHFTMLFPDLEIKIVESEVSRYYFQIEKINRLELKVVEPGIYNTIISF